MNSKELMDYHAAELAKLNDFLQQRKLPPHTWGRNVVGVAMEYIKDLENQVERHKNSLKETMTLTDCDDTWDYINRALQAKENTNPSYRFGKGGTHDH